MHTERASGGRRGRPERTCVGCGQRDDAARVLRLVVEGGEVAFDLGGGAFGRGAHVHPTPACIAGVGRGLARALRAPVLADPRHLGALLEMACARRANGLFLAARRLGALDVGAEAAEKAVREGAPLLVLACDAGAVARSAAVTRAVSEGRAIAWGTKLALGTLLGCESIAVCAVRHAGIAEELKRLRAAADAGASAAAGRADAGTTEGTRCRSPEAG